MHDLANGSDTAYKKYSKEHYDMLLSELKGLERERIGYGASPPGRHIEESAVARLLRRHHTSANIPALSSTPTSPYLDISTPIESSRSASTSRVRSARSTSSQSSSVYTHSSSALTSSSSKKKKSSSSTTSKKMTKRHRNPKATLSSRSATPAPPTPKSASAKKKSSKYQKQLTQYKALCSTELKARDMLLSISFAEMENQLALFQLQAEVHRWKRENPKMKPGHSVEAMEAQMRQLSKKRWEPRYDRVLKKLEYAVAKRMIMEKKYLSGTGAGESSNTTDSPFLTVPPDDNLYEDDVPRSPKSKKRFTKFVTSLQRKMELHLLQVKHRILQYQYQHSQSKQKQREIMLEETMGSLSSAYLFMNKKRLVNKMSALSDKHTHWLSEARNMCQSMIDLPRRIPEFGDVSGFPSTLLDMCEDVDEEAQSVDQAAPLISRQQSTDSSLTHTPTTPTLDATPVLSASNTTMDLSIHDDSPITPSTVTSPTESLVTSISTNTTVTSSRTATSTLRTRPVIPALSFDFPTPTKHVHEDSLPFSSFQKRARKDSLNTVYSTDGNESLYSHGSGSSSITKGGQPISARAQLQRGNTSARSRLVERETVASYPASHSTAVVESVVVNNGSQSARYHRTSGSSSARLLSQETRAPRSARSETSSSAKHESSPQAHQLHHVYSASPKLQSKSARARASSQIKPANLLKYVEELRSATGSKTHTSHLARQQKSRSSRNLLEVSEAPNSKPMLFRPRSTPRKLGVISPRDNVARKSSITSLASSNDSARFRTPPVQTIAQDSLLEASSELLQDVSSFLSSYQSSSPGTVRFASKELMQTRGGGSVKSSAAPSASHPRLLERRESYVDLHKHPSFKNKMKRHKTYTNVKDIQFAPDAKPDAEWYESKLLELNSLREKLQTEATSPR